jgi:hypothetical protein
MYSTVLGICKRKNAAKEKRMAAEMDEIRAEIRGLVDA